MTTMVRQASSFLTIAALVMILSFAITCGGQGDGGTPEAPDATGEILTVTIGPELVDCVAVGPWECMVVDGELFYEAIDGFDYEEGYTYRIRMERYDAWPDQDEPPQDASKYGYRLIEVISRESDKS